MISIFGFQSSGWVLFVNTAMNFRFSKREEIFSPAKRLLVSEEGVAACNVSN
jgi:hypothetical protein